MAVKIGSARIDENGAAHGGKAGDQTGKEVSTQNWYLHSKGWRVFRAKAPAKAEQIAKTMQAACDNKHIGYDQYQRNTLYTQAEKVGFDVARVTTDCETDCSALVRVCCASAGILGLPADFRTGNMPTNLNKTGAFTELTGDKYQKQSTYLRRGDILVTKTSGHTVVVLSNGSKAETVSVIDGLSKGDTGEAVTAMQRALLVWNPNCLPKWGADGDFGSETEEAVKAYQKAEGLTVTGIYDTVTKNRLSSIGVQEKLRVTGGAVNVRNAPGVDSKVLGVVHKDDLLLHQGAEKSVNGTTWYQVEFKGQNGWISGKYSRIEA